jgi:hypothetical protein
MSEVMPILHAIADGDPLELSGGDRQMVVFSYS